MICWSSKAWIPGGLKKKKKVSNRNLLPLKTESYIHLCNETWEAPSILIGMGHSLPKSLIVAL